MPIPVIPVIEIDHEEPKNSGERSSWDYPNGLVYLTETQELFHLSHIVQYLGRCVLWYNYGDLFTSPNKKTTN